LLLEAQKRKSIEEEAPAAPESPKTPASPGGKRASISATERMQAINALANSSKVELTRGVLVRPPTTPAAPGPSNTPAAPGPPPMPPSQSTPSRVQCPLCDVSTPIREMETHMQNCDHREVNCRFCSKTMKEKDRASHEKTCQGTQQVDAGYDDDGFDNVGSDGDNCPDEYDDDNAFDNSPGISITRPDFGTGTGTGTEDDSLNAPVVGQSSDAYSDFDFEDSEAIVQPPTAKPGTMRISEFNKVAASRNIKDDGPLVKASKEKKLTLILGGDVTKIAQSWINKTGESTQVTFVSSSELPGGDGVLRLNKESQGARTVEAGGKATFQVHYKAPASFKSADNQELHCCVYILGANDVLDAVLFKFTLEAPSPKKR